MIPLLVKSAAAFCISTAFGVLFGVKKHNLAFAGLCGMAGGFVYTLVGAGKETDYAALLAASVVLAVCSEVFARLRRSPTTVFLIAGLIPLVPGGRIYLAMQLAVAGQPEEAALSLYTMLLEAGTLALGIILVSSLLALHRKQLKKK